MKKYETYKDSGIDWIGEIPSHWEVKRFGHLFSFSRGLGITKQDLKDEGIPCINYGEIHSKFGFSVNPEIHRLKCVEEEYLVTADKSLLKRGDFVFADTSEDIEGSGNFTVLDSDIPTFAGYHTVIARHENGNHYKYLAYSFDSLEFRNQIRSAVSGIKVFSITNAILKSSKVQLPSYPEQTAIAIYLDRKTAEIDELIADKKRLLQLYEEEKTAIINQAVTKGINPDVPMKDSGIEWLGEIPDHWLATSLKRLVSTKITDGPHETPAFLLEGVPFASAESVKNGKIDFNFIRGYISSEDDEKYSKKCKPKKDDIFIVKSGSTTGKIALVDFDKNFNIWSPLALVRVNQKVNFLFMYYSLQSDYFQDSIRLFWSFGTQPNIGMNVIENLKVAFAPDIKEQLEIVHHIEKNCLHIDGQIAKIKKLIDLLSEYRTALISEVVTGKVKVI